MPNPPEWFIKGLADMSQKIEDDYEKHLTASLFANNDAPPAVFPVRPLEEWEKVTGTIGGPDRSGNMLAQMEKFIRQMRLHTPKRDPIDKVAMGQEALAELRRMTSPHTVAMKPGDPMGLGAIQIVASEVLDPDQWIAYDRAGKIVAMGRVNSVRLVVAASPFPSP